MADRVAIALDVMDAFNERDLERLLPHLHPDYEATWPHGHLTGEEAMAHELTILAAFPDVQMVVQRATETDDGVLLEARTVGTQTGDWTSPAGEHFPASGRSIDAPIAFVMVFEGDLIRSERLYFDQLSLQAPLRS